MDTEKSDPYIYRKPPKKWKYKFFEKNIIDFNNSINSNIEKIITSECGFPEQENQSLDLIRLIKYYLKNYMIKFIRNIFIKSVNRK